MKEASTSHTVHYTGAPRPVALKEKFARIPPPVDICDNYWMTGIFYSHFSRDR